MAAHLEDVPLDDGPPGVLQSLLPMLEARLVLLVLAPAQLDLPDGISTTDQIVVANLNEETLMISGRKDGVNITVMSRVTLFISISSMMKTKDSFQ